MARERRGGGPPSPRRSRSAGDTGGGGETQAPLTRGERVRRRLAAQPEIELTEEELRALADDGIDPEDVRRLARERREFDEASDHDRDTARDHLEGLVAEHEDDY